MNDHLSLSKDQIDSIINKIFCCDFSIEKKCAENGSAIVVEGCGNLDHITMDFCVGLNNYYRGSIYWGDVRIVLSRESVKGVVGGISRRLVDIEDKKLREGVNSLKSWISE